jgi:hypothetical protein
MAHEANVVVDRKSEACDVECTDFLEDEYIRIICSETYYTTIWNRLKCDALLIEKLKDIESPPPCIVVYPGIQRQKATMTLKDIMASTIVTVIVYSSLAGIGYCIWVGAKRLLGW